MKLPTIFRRKPTPSLSTEKDSTGPTIAHSTQHMSVDQAEKQDSLSSASSRQNTQHEKEKRIVESTPLEEAQALENLSDEPEYPSGLRLGIIMTSLALSVFLMALVSPMLLFSPSGMMHKILTHRSLRGEPHRCWPGQPTDPSPG